MENLYLSDSECLDFSSADSGVSSYFIMTLLICENLEISQKIQESLTKTVEKFKNEASNLSQLTQKLKGSSTSIDAKKYFFEHLPKAGWNIYSVIVNYSDAYTFLSMGGDQNNFYNFLAKLLIEKINFPPVLKTVELMADRYRNKNDLKDFQKYLKNHIQFSMPKLKISINETQKLLDEIQEFQAVDLFCWGIYKKYNGKDKEWYNIFKEFIKFEEIIQS